MLKYNTEISLALAASGKKSTSAESLLKIQRRFKSLIRKGLLNICFFYNFSEALYKIWKTDITALMLDGNEAVDLTFSSNYAVDIRK